MRNNWTCLKHKVLIAEGHPCPLCLEEKIRTRDIEKIKENERQRQTEMRKELAKIRFAEATL